VTERRAWLIQARADLTCAEHVLGSQDPARYCHVLAKYQQAVEKAIKGLIAALRDAGVLAIEIGYGHGIERFLKVLVKLPHAAENKEVQASIRQRLDPKVRGDIRALDALAPKRPAPGALPARNTEYPFRQGDEWRAPAEAETFSAADVERFRALAHRIVPACERTVSAIERSQAKRRK
jgi:HEPN domain-containing protein